VGKLPALKPREVVGLLEGLGFAEVRQKGSYKQFRHADGRGTTVPFHAGRDISPTLLRRIKGMKQTSAERIGRSQLIPSVRRTFQERRHRPWDT
jgi:predicted RNA binding protein YcfA (HicA-like mRNA interferase family)